MCAQSEAGGLGVMSAEPTRGDRPGKRNNEAGMKSRLVLCVFVACMTLVVV